MPHGGSIDVSPIATNDSPAIAVDVAEAARTPDISINANPLLNDAGVSVAAPVAEDDTAISVIAENPAAQTQTTGLSNDSSPAMLADAEPAVVEEASVSPVDVSPVDVETAPVDVPELTAGNDLPAELPTSVEAVGTEEASVQPVAIDSAPVDIPELAVSCSPARELATDVEPVVTGPPVSSDDGETAPVAMLDLVVSHEPSSDVLVDIEPAIVDDPQVALADIEVAAADIPAVSIDSGSSADVAIEIEPVLASDPAPVTAVATDASADTSGGVADIAPEPIPVSPTPEIRSSPKVRARATEPADRAELIRQRWAETGIRMWNPRLHGTGDATLNIQGRVELLPPAPGETMPRYDKLEFRMLGGQIVCEGVIVEAPAQASHRSFTRLAEPGKPDRVREPVRERQAALA